MTMMKKEWSDLNWNKPLVDRMLGVAYERVKQVQENLDALKFFTEHLTAVEEGKESLDNLANIIANTNTGSYLVGQELGHVGEDGKFEPTDATQFIRALALNISYFKPIFENLDHIQKAGIYIQDIIALALGIDAIKNVSDSLSDVKTVNSYKDSVKTTANSIQSIVSLAQEIETILFLKDKMPELDTIDAHIESLQLISEKIHSLVTLSNNLEDIQTAISYYSDFKEVLDNKELIALMAESQNSIEFINTNSANLQKLVDNQDKLFTLLHYLDTFTILALHVDDMHKVVDNIELIKEYADMSEKITALYSALYPEAERTEAVVEPDQTIQSLIDSMDSGARIILSQDIAENLTIPNGKIINLDLNGYKITNRLELDTIRVELGGTLNLYGSGTIDNTTKNKAPIFNNGSCIIKDTTITKSIEEYYNILNHGRMVLGTGVTCILGANALSSNVVNGYYDYTSTNERLGHVLNTNLTNPSIIINGGSYIGGQNVLKNDDGGIATINNGEFIHTKESDGAALFNVNQLSVKYCVASSTHLYAIYNRKYNDTTDVGNTIIENGKFTGSVSNTNGTLAIKGGEFTADVSEYMV